MYVSYNNSAMEARDVFSVSPDLAGQTGLQTRLKTLDFHLRDWRHVTNERSAERN